MKGDFNRPKMAVSDYPEPLKGPGQFAPAGQIRDFRNALLREHIRFAAQNSPYYRALFKRLNLSADDFHTVEDLHRLPCTGKKELLEHNKEFQAVPDEQIVDVCLTSATSGDKPAMLQQTQSDLARLAYNEEIAFKMCGITEKDTLVVCAALDRAFMAGLAYFLGGLKRNARMVRSGAGNAAQHWHLIRLCRATAIVGVPSLMRRIAEYALQNGHDPRQAGVRRLIAIGEPTRDGSLELLPLTRQLEELWAAEIYSTYASTEIATTFCECGARRGGHVRPELIVTEITDDAGSPLPPGQIGEVTVTPLGVTGMPLLRFKTGDISYLIDEPCPCGRTTQRLAPILGRKHQMLKFKGTTIFPNAILAALEGHADFAGGYVEAHNNPDGTDHVVLFAAVHNPSFDKNKIETELQARVRVVPEVRVVDRQAVEERVYQPDKKRKRITFFDLRKNNG